MVLADAMAVVHDRGCFEDEVAIDFPAIAPVVDRMRAAMLGAEWEPMARRAAIRVSPREALAGVTLPIELPVRRTCHGCGGRGESWAEPCPVCAGSGERSTPHVFTVSVPAGVADGTRFTVLVGTPHGLPTRIEVTVLVA
jgi:hypothetical protein